MSGHSRSGAHILVVDRIEANPPEEVALTFVGTRDCAHSEVHYITFINNKLNVLDKLVEFTIKERANLSMPLNLQELVLAIYLDAISPGKPIGLLSIASERTLECRV